MTMLEEIARKGASSGVGAVEVCVCGFSRRGICVTGMGRGRKLVQTTGLTSLTASAQCKQNGKRTKRNFLYLRTLPASPLPSSAVCRIFCCPRPSIPASRLLCRFYLLTYIYSYFFLAFLKVARWFPKSTLIFLFFFFASRRLHLVT